jgi:enterochelin esterase-like enzyme
MNLAKSSNYELMTNMRMVLLCGVIAMLVSLSRAVEIGGQWRAEFDTQIGLQKYVFTFHSSAPNTKSPEQLVPDPSAATRQLKLLWLSCGNKDGLIRISQGVHAFLKEKQVPHVWHVDGNGHDPTHWKNNLWQFAQRIFK